MVIKKNTISYKSNWIHYAVEFNKKANRFSIKLPEHIKDFNKDSTGEISGTDLVILEREFKQIVEEYYNATLTKRPVIIYRALFNCPRSEGRIAQEQMHFAPDIAIGLEYNTALEVMFSNGNTIYFHFDATDNEISGARMNRYHGLQPSDSPRERIHVIEWTQEREDWFKNTEEAMLKMIDKITLFFGDEPKTLIENISQIQNNLLPVEASQEEKKKEE